MLDTITRTPPKAIRDWLRKEVGYLCAHPRCDSPYLTYHHFDPEWHVENHHRAEGMIALCAAHHDRASTWTSEDFKIWKKRGPKPQQIRAAVEWRRKYTILAAGSNLVVGPSVIVETANEPILWLTEDEEGRALFNLTIRDASGNLAFTMRDNDWEWLPLLTDLEVPPKGRSLSFGSESLGIKVNMKFRETTVASALKLSGRSVTSGNAKHMGFESKSSKFFCVH